MSDKRAGAESTGLIRIEAPSYREALREIGDRFGSDYSIVHTRVIRRKGMKGLLGVTGVEVYVTDKSQYNAWREHAVPGAAPGVTAAGAAPAAPGTPNARGVPPAPGARPRVPYGQENNALSAAERQANLLAASLGINAQVGAATTGAKPATGPSPQSHEVLERLQ
ncbi:MAG: hypothetical protein AAF581_23305, partial [Planctomycetota bacterium]